MMTEEKVGIMKFTVSGLKDLTTALENVYGKDKIINMPIWRGDDGLYMQLAKGSGFINLVKDSTELLKLDV